MNVGVFLPTALNSFAVVYLVISLLVHTKCPCAPDPLACTTRSGMRSRLKCAIFSNNKKSSKTTGPRGPTVSEFWLSPTGRPASVVIIFFFSAIGSSSVGSHSCCIVLWLPHGEALQIVKRASAILPIYSSPIIDRLYLWLNSRRGINKGAHQQWNCTNS